MKRVLTIFVALLLLQIAYAAKQPKYVFLFIGDGMGHAHVALTQAALSAKEGRIGYTPLSFTQFPEIGYATTCAANRLTTCSAAAGTALATGSKTSINTIGMNADRTKNLESIALKAKRKGMKVGIASSVSIDHATPASFYAHCPDRNMSYKIGEWAAKEGFDLYASSGLLKPNDGRNLYEILKDSAYNIVYGANLPLTGKKIFWQQKLDANQDALPLAIDSKNGDLTLSEITEKSIAFLENKKGFFLMVEGGQIDWAAHANDAASIVHETKDFSNAISKAVDFYNRYPNETLIVVTADHETGGLTLGLDSRGYETDLAKIFAQKISKGKLESAIKETKSWDEAKALLSSSLGFWGEVQLTAKEELQLLVAYERKAESAAKAAINILHTKAGVGFTTGSHTPTYVPVYAIGIGAEQFSGAIDNTDIPNKITKIAGY